MVFGQMICIAGAGLVTRARLTTGFVELAAYLVLTGIGMGISQQIPYTAIQVLLR